jgi:PAS domain S-box-containing protein
MAHWEFDVPTGIFTFNDRFYALYGTTAEREGGYQMPAEVYTKEFTHPDDQYMVAEEITKALAAPDPGYSALTEHRIIRRDGEVRYIVVRIRVEKDAEGRTVKTHGANQDITERRKAEDAVRSANRQLTLLNDITRHDILNKVSVILGFLKITEMKFKDPALAEFLKKITSATGAIKEQIAFTKTYENLGTQEPQWIVLDTILPRTHLPATILLYADLPGISIHADPMLEKVFFNLLDNSIRHGERVTEIRVSSHEDAQSLVIVWEDNGVGIALDEKEHVFERGFGKNTGLGMFLVREILSLTGIAIKETGVPEKGARFEIRVPKGAFRVTGE